MATWALLVTGIGVVLVIGLLTAWSIHLLARYRRRDERASELQRRIAEPISRDPGLANAAILPTAMLHGDGDTTVVITGQVESEAARRRVLDIARRVAPSAMLVDQLEVVSPDPHKTG